MTTEVNWWHLNKMGEDQNQLCGAPWDLGERFLAMREAFLHPWNISLITLNISYFGITVFRSEDVELGGSISGKFQVIC